MMRHVKEAFIENVLVKTWCEWPKSL